MTMGRTATELQTALREELRGHQKREVIRIGRGDVQTLLARLTATEDFEREVIARLRMERAEGVRHLSSAKRAGDQRKADHAQGVIDAVDNLAIAMTHLFGRSREAMLQEVRR